ncbi:MAG: SPOR domain-containing protein [Rhodobacteraceae bacterium]|nr:SPOR domain-containing protein [Paracoccaceae bacterium]
MAEQFYSNASQAGADQHSLSVGSIIHWVGTGVSVALLAGGIYWAFSIASRDVTQIPVVSAQITPMREAPENPGGKATENQGLNVTQVAAMENPPVAETIILAPAAQPLSDEDLPTAERLQLAKSAPTTAQEGETELAVDVNALADAIIAGEKPLSDIQPMPVRVEGANIEQALRMAAAVRLPSEPTIATGSALVQFGAYDSQAVAEQEWTRISAKLASLLGNQTRVIQKAESGGRTFYRLRAAGFSDIAEARRFCSAVSEKAECYPVIAK